MHGSGRYANLDGLQVYFETEGAGPPVVIVGGGPGVGHAHYHPWFGRLAEHHTVVYYDHPGTGRSDRVTTGLSIDLYADAIDAVRLALGAERINLIAISFGGIPAARYLIDRSSHVERVVLSNAQISASGWQEGNIDNFNSHLREHFPEVWEQALELRSKGTRSSAPDYQDLVGVALPRLEWANESDRPTLENDPVEGFEMSVYTAFVGDDPEWVVGGALAGFDPRPSLKGLAVPTLVVSGRFDGLTSPRIARGSAELLGAELIVFERSGHRPWAEEPDAYFEAVRAFLA